MANAYIDALYAGSLKLKISYFFPSNFTFYKWCVTKVAYCIVWSPHTDLDINKLESVQRRAARWVTRDYQYTSSLSTMLQDLNWRTLDQRRIDSRLVLLYKVTYDLVAIPASDYLIRNTRPFKKSPDSVPTDHNSKRLL